VVRMLGRFLAVLVLALLQGCLTAEDDGGTDSGAEGQGAPIGNGGTGEAPGAPIDIPAITIAEGQPLDAVRAQLEEKLKEACGGDVCLVIEVAETDGNHETCQYSGETDPPGGTQVERGSTVTLVMGSLPCTDADGDGISDDNDGDGVADDTDGDGTPDVLDDDADGDGTPDAEQPSS
jgi:large repetitive protein